MTLDAVRHAKATLEAQGIYPSADAIVKEIGGSKRDVCKYLHELGLPEAPVKHFSPLELAQGEVARIEDILEGLDEEVDTAVNALQALHGAQDQRGRLLGRRPDNDPLWMKRVRRVELLQQERNTVWASQYQPALDALRSAEHNAQLDRVFKGPWSYPDPNKPPPPPPVDDSPLQPWQTLDDPSRRREAYRA